MPAPVSDRTILDAVVATVGRRGYAGATTRQIAAAAGINEVTLFRRFGDKRRLVLAAVHADIGPFAATGTQATDDLEADLRRVLTYYAGVLADHGELLLVLMIESARDPDLGELIREPLSVQGELRRLIEHHQRAGRLVDEPPSAALHALIGPLLAHAIATMLEHDPPPPPSADALLERFLHGHARASVRRPG